MRIRHLLTIAVCLASCTRGTVAAPPPKGFLFPAGGQRGQTVSLVAKGTFEPWPVHVWIDGHGVQLAPDAQAGKFRLEIAADAAPGIRWVRLFNAEGAAPPIPLLVGMLAEITEVEPNDEPAQAQPVSLPAITANGQLDHGADVDVFAVTLQAGQTLVADLEARRHRGAPMDGILQIVSPQGFVLRENDDAGGLDPRLVYTAEHDGPVLVRLFAFPAEPDSSIALSSSDKHVYRLTLTTGPFFDHCFPLAIEQGKQATVELHGWNLGGQHCASPLTLPTGRDVQTFIHPTIAGEAFVRAVPQGTTIENEPNDSVHPQALPLPCAVSGRIGEPRDADVYAVELRKDQPVLLRLESHRFGLPLEPLLTITAVADCKQVFQQAANGSQRDTEAVFTPPADGMYHLTVSDLIRQGSPRHVYCLSITNEKDFALFVPASELTVAAGAALEIVVQVKRQLNFADEIEVSLEGLPDGTACPAARSKAGDDSAGQVKLTLTAGAAPFGGIISIRGKSLGDAPIERTAAVTPSASQPFSGKPWLTITP